jgi:hypothetical protein
MNIDIDSNDLIGALSAKIATLTVELETTKLALSKTQEICNSLSDALSQIMREADSESSVQIMDEEELREFVADDSSFFLLENNEIND